MKVKRNVGSGEHCIHNVETNDPLCCDLDISTLDNFYSPKNKQHSDKRSRAPTLSDVSYWSQADSSLHIVEIY